VAEVARRLQVYGRVQGVAYRAWTVQTAQALGVRGWVRNRRDGSVEALLVGAEAAVARLIEACRRGPPAAQVARIDISDPGPSGTIADFRQLPTA
jgi:acylphosphatase